MDGGEGNTTAVTRGRMGNLFFRVGITHEQKPRSSRENMSSRILVCVFLPPIYTPASTHNRSESH
jgi:hypothetical protein